MSLVAGLVALAAVLVNRPTDANELGSVSDHWIAQQQ